MIASWDSSHGMYSAMHLGIRVFGINTIFSKIRLIRFPLIGALALTRLRMTLT